MITTVDNLIEALQQTYPKEIKIVITDSNNNSVTLTNDSIVQKSFSFNRYVFPSTKPCFGTTIAGEVQFSAYKTASLSALNLDGAEFRLQIGVMYNSTVSYIGLGNFVIDNVEINNNIITISALDYLRKLDTLVNVDALRFPVTISNLIVQIRKITGVTIGSASSFPNASYQITAFPSGYENVTYRQLLGWCCEILGVCAFAQYGKTIKLSWINDYTAKTSTKLNADRRYSSTFGDPITISGIKLTLGSTEYLQGTSAYTIDITDNPLITHDYTTILANLASRIGTTYTPCRASAIPMPYLEPLDKISATNKAGSDCNILISDLTIGINQGTELASIGECESNSSYVSTRTFSNSQVYALNQLETKILDQSDTNLESAMAFNELVSNALGFYYTKQDQADGSIKYYMHDSVNLTDSTNIFTMTANGIAWTNSGWNGGNPNWSYGVTSAGDGFFRYISAQGISVAKAGQDYRIEVTPSAFSIYYQDMLVTQIVADTMNVPHINASASALLGNLMFIPHYTDGAIDGTDIVFMK